MINTLLIIPDCHAHPKFSNARADWLGQFMADLKPDFVVNMGDAADMPSLSSYDKGKRSTVGRNYRDDINSHLDFQDRMWSPLKRLKKKMPYSVILEGNHEHRIERALDLSPEYEGSIGFKDYDFNSYYDEVIRYDGGLPGIYEVENILFAHYLPTGISGRPVGGERAAHMLLAKHNNSCVVAHSHLYDFATRTNVRNQTINGLVVGCYQDYINDWAGPVGHMWRAGVTVLRNVEDGDYDLEFVSLKTLEKEYG